MKVIYKYQIKDPHDIEFAIPQGAQILTVQMQDVPTIWALVTPGNSLEVRRFKLIMTGEEFEQVDGLKYIGTVQKEHSMIEDQVVVGHLFEDLTKGD